MQVLDESSNGKGKDVEDTESEDTVEQKTEEKEGELKREPEQKPDCCHKKECVSPAPATESGKPEGEQEKKESADEK